MKSLAILNGSRKNDGITQGSLLFYEEFRKNDRKVTWYQIQDTGNVKDLPRSDVVLKGVTFPGYTISNGLNRLIFLKKKVREIKDDLVLLSDPTLISLFDKYTNLAVRIHDFRVFSKYNDKKLTRMMYNHILPKLKKVECALFSTEYVANQAEDFGIAPEQKFIIPEPTELPEDPGLNIQSSVSNVEEGKITFSYVATDRPYKNIDFFLKIASAFSSNQDYNFKLLCNTGKNRTEEIRKYHPNVSIINGIENITDFYRQSDILLYPSLFEGFGRPVVEAMSYGIPVLASDIEPIREVSDGSCQLIEPNKLDLWVESIMKITQPAQYKSASEKSRKRFQYFSPLRFSERVDAMMNTLI